MGAPLAALSRHSVAVRLYDSFGLQDRAGIAPALAFGRAEDAAAYLGYWMPDAAAITALRHALYRCEQSLAVFSFPDPHIIHLLAGKLAQGALLITEGEPVSERGGWPLIPVSAAPVPDSTVLVRLDATPAPLPVPPLLPVLEELQIEGAEVLPEIEQTLEQIDLTMGSIDLAGVSLEPTPSKVPQIETAMTAATASVTKTLDEL
ncbi:MAG TPA: hypothetical protein VNS31_14245 [Ramlibacter sp.]|nr:hypothetical protein [Ramlibacter sp.]